MNEKAKRTVICAYGFDKLGFSRPRAAIEGEDFTIELVDYSGSESLGKANGIIVPSGIFEAFEEYRDHFGMGKTRVKSDQGLFAQREKELLNALERGAWVCFLLGEIWNGPEGRWLETDLAKKYLNIFFAEIHNHEPNPHIQVKSDEFRAFLENYGISQTAFAEPKGNNDFRILATEHYRMAAAEINGKIFFLPFFTTKRDGAELHRALTLVARAVIDYKKRNDIYLPGWVSAIQFKREVLLQAEIRQAEEKLATLTGEVKRWRDYKAVLCTSGQTLNIVVVSVFRTLFGLDLKSEERYVEDAIIYGADGKASYVVEIKGVSGGIRRENINQVDSHRERLSLPESVPGLLVINDFMNVEDFEERKKKEFDREILAHARKTNVKILRTITLIEIMLRHQEADNQKTILLDLLQKADPLVVLE